MTATLFLSYLAFVVLLVTLIAIWFLPAGQMMWTLAGLSLWLAYVGWLSAAGLIADATRRPPGIVFLAVPLVVFFVILFRSSVPGQLEGAAWVLMLLQTFRVGVELLLHQLFVDGTVPKLMTYEGGNWDILVGISAPLVAWLAAKKRVGPTPLLIWNVAGLLFLANIVVRALLTSPGAMHLLPSEVANRAVGMFPFTYIAGFFAPLAMVLHVIVLKSMKRP